MPGFYETATKRLTKDSIYEERETQHLSRIAMWKATLDIIEKNPVLGLGLGERKFISALEAETDFINKYGRVLDNPHNSYLQIAVMAGSIALIVFLNINRIVFVKGIKGIKNQNKKRSSYYSGILAGTIAGLSGFLVSLVFDMPMFTHAAVMYWIVIGMCSEIFEQLLE